MKEKIIMCNGDSFTHEYHLPIEKRWTTLLGVQHNLGVGAGSNDRIFNTTIEFLNQNFIDIMIIGWTSHNRTFFNYKDGTKIIICNDRAFNDTHGVKSQYPDIVKFYYQHIFNEYVQFRNTLEYMVHLQNYCELSNIRLINFLSVPNKEDFSEESLKKISSHAFMDRSTEQLIKNGILHNTNILKSLIAKLKPINWVNNSVFFSMSEHCKDFPTDKIGHPDVEGSEHWFKTIKNYIDTVDNWR